MSTNSHSKRNERIIFGTKAGDDERGTMNEDLLFKFGRRIRLGLVGGGQDSVIGRTHLVAMRVDGLCDLVAGCMSIDPEVAKASGHAELLDEDRIYTDFREMAEKEAARQDGIDSVVIATPPQLPARSWRVAST